MCPYTEFFLSVFSRIRTEYRVSLRIQSKCGKIWTRKSPNKELFTEGILTYAIFGGLEVLMRNNLLLDKNRLLVLYKLFFISNSLQEVITLADFFAALSADHSPVTISNSKN